MSGKPTPDGARHALELIDAIAKNDALIENLRKSCEALRTTEDETARMRRELYALLRSMDVESVGNAGYEGRTAWLLAEVVRLARGDR